jgi:putative acetyltransferase
MMQELQIGGTRPAFTLRAYREADEAAAIELWRRTWQIAYPKLDFDARVDWWRERWRNELVPKASITIAEHDGTLVGFVTIEPDTGYLDQIVVAPELWGGDLADMLVKEAQRISPTQVTLHVNVDNTRAVRFYEKQGFVITGEEKNPRSGAPIYKMSWAPRA